MRPYQIFVESLQIRLLHVQSYQLDFQWAFQKRVLQHTILWYIEHGSFSLEVDGKAYHCRKGQICLLPDHSVIGCHAVSDEIRLVSINFDAEIAFFHDRGWAWVLNLPIVFEEYNNEWKPLIAELLEHEKTGGAFRVLAMQSVLLRILYGLLSKSNMADPELPFLTMDIRVRTIVDYLLCHLETMPTVAKLAELAGLSESHLRKLFIRDTGQAPLSFVYRLKIEQAKKWLVASNKPISQIAEELGMKDANYFTRRFKTETGMAPLPYRKQFRLG